MIALTLLVSSPIFLYASEPLPNAEPVYFDYDSTSLTLQTQQQLREVAEMMKRKPKLQVKLFGYTDERGSAEFSLAAGERRAKAVMSYLIHTGIAPERITFISRGKERPRDPRHDEIAWARNRRVEFVFRDAGGTK
jgi:peptidoglycan-associated lipoprotein